MACRLSPRSKSVWMVSCLPLLHLQSLKELAFRIWIVVYYCFITPALSRSHPPTRTSASSAPPPPLHHHCPPPPSPFTLSLLSIPFLRHSATVLAWFDLAWLQRVCTRQGEPTLRCFCLHTLFADIVCTEYCL